MYKFIPMTKTETETTFQPVDNMKFNGKYLNEIVDGYRQLHVSGRSIVSREVQLIDIPYRDGQRFESVKDKPRELKITYQLQANSSEELRDKYALLNKELRSNELVPIQFDDEPEYTYYGVFETGNDKAEQGLMTVDSFTIICPDSKKYRALAMTSDGQMPSDMEADFVYPSKMVIAPNGTTNHIEVTNGEDRIVLNGAYNGGSIIITWGDEVEITYNGHNELVNLQQFSGLEFFKLKPNMRITGTNCRITSIEWSDERL